MLRASRLLATSGGTTTIRAAAATTSRAATTATKRISATERVARWRGTLDAVARTARAQAGSSVATSARWRRTLHHMARTPMLPACALATITLARPPANCEVAVAVPPKRTMPQKELARRQDRRRLVAPRFSRRALGAVCTSDTVFEKVVVAPRPLRDRGLRPDGREARAVVGDAARRLPRGLVRTVAESSSPRWHGGRRDDSAERAAAIASTALVGVEATRRAVKTQVRRCDLLQNRATRATQTRREALRTLADAFPGGDTVLGGTVGAGCVAPCGGASAWRLHGLSMDIDNVAVQGRDSRAAASSGSDVASTPSTRRLASVDKRRTRAGASSPAEPRRQARAPVY